MSLWRRKFGRALTVAALALTALLPLARETHAQGNPPQWVSDSFVTPFPLNIPGRLSSNPYVSLFMYYAGEDISRFSLWTRENGGDPETPEDDFFYLGEPPWGSMILSGLRPSLNNEVRPHANHLTIRVEDPTATGGFTNFRFPEDGAAQFGPPIIPVPPVSNSPGFWAPFNFPAGGPSTSGIDFEANQIVTFARDLVRIEVAITNRGASRRFGGRLLIDPYVDVAGARRQYLYNPDNEFDPNDRRIPDRSVLFPQSRQRVRFETEFRGAGIPDEYVMYDFADRPVYSAKQIFRGNGATPPNRVVVGNSLDIWPFLDDAAQYEWPVRPQMRLDISDIGILTYWDPVVIGSGQTKSFVTYAGMGAADHGMSLFYQNKAAGQLEGEGYVGGVQTPPAVGLTNGFSNEAFFPVHADVYHTGVKPIDDAIAALTLPVGLELANPDDPLVQDLGFVPSLEVSNGSSQRVTWNVRPNGIKSGILEVTVDFNNAFGDPARAVRRVNVPQGRRYQIDNQYRMITFPFDFGTAPRDPAQVLNLPRSTFRMLRYNPQLNRYEEVSEIRPGEAYWVKMDGQPATFVDVQGGAPIQVGRTRNVLTTIRRGWNQVGNPSPYAVRVADLEILTPSGFINYKEAVRRGEIRPTLYEYDFQARRYIPLAADSILQPGRGVWLFSNLTERRIRWAEPEGPGLVLK